jgi:alanine-alpha-ketoisovalerate/valine-pyruvate aminotransferase
VNETGKLVGTDDIFFNDIICECTNPDINLSENKRFKYDPDMEYIENEKPEKHGLKFAF